MELTEKEVSMILLGLTLLEQQYGPNHKIGKSAHKLWHKIYNLYGKGNSKRTSKQVSPKDL